MLYIFGLCTVRTVICIYYYYYHYYFRCSVFFFFFGGTECVCICVYVCHCMYASHIMYPSLVLIFTLTLTIIRSRCIYLSVFVCVCYYFDMSMRLGRFTILSAFICVYWYIFFFTKSLNCYCCCTPSDVAIICFFFIYSLHFACSLAHSFIRLSSISLFLCKILSPSTYISFNIITIHKFCQSVSQLNTQRTTQTNTVKSKQTI